MHATLLPKEPRRSPKNHAASEGGKKNRPALDSSNSIIEPVLIRPSGPLALAKSPGQPAAAPAAAEVESSQDETDEVEAVNDDMLVDE